VNETLCIKQRRSDSHAAQCLSVIAPYACLRLAKTNNTRPHKSCKKVSGSGTAAKVTVPPVSKLPGSAMPPLPLIIIFPPNEGGSVPEIKFTAPALTSIVPPRVMSIGLIGASTIPTFPITPTFVGVLAISDKFVPLVSIIPLKIIFPDVSKFTFEVRFKIPPRLILPVAKKVTVSVEDKPEKFNTPSDKISKVAS
jgi:hypothetical protein